MITHVGGTVECAVIGGGPAGLAASTALTDRGVEHVVLERGQVGETWRTQRWASFRLNTPGWMNHLGEQAPDAFASRIEVVRQLEALAAGSPVHSGVQVTQLAPQHSGYILRTSADDLHSRAVVVATGGQNVPRMPDLARTIPAGVTQQHAADYRSSGGLPDGAVLVVGSAQSGCQITADLLAAGRRVVLATSPVGRLPWRHRGRDMVEWLVGAGFFDQRPEDLADASVMRAAQPVVGSGGRSLSLQGLARAGAVLTGRPVAVSGRQITFDDSLGDNVAAGDAFAARLRALADDLIRRHGLLAPAAEPDEAERPVDLNPPAVLDLGTEQIGSVVWCTGFTGDFSWLHPALRDDRGEPRRRGAASAPGLWYLGLRWLTRRGSGILHGFPGDAATVADAVRSRLDATAAGT